MGKSFPPRLGNRNLVLGWLCKRQRVGARELAWRQGAAFLNLAPPPRRPAHGLMVCPQGLKRHPPKPW